MTVKGSRSFLALCVLTVVAVQGDGPRLRPLQPGGGLGIAITKATLVVLYFMHARYSPRLTGIVIASILAFLVILVFLLLTDYISRPWPLVAAG